MAMSKVSKTVAVDGQTDAVADRPAGGAAVEKAGSASALKKRELIEQVVAETGLKRGDIRPVVEAALSVMGRALGDGKSLNLEPLGKLRVARTNETEGARVMTCKLRQKTLASPAE
jgi:nucleoid DNA-binding protein